MITMEMVDKLRQDAGIILEDSFESGSKYQVGDRELVNIVKLAKMQAYKECIAHAQGLEKPAGEDDHIQASCNITCNTIAALIANEAQYCRSVI